MRGITSGYDVIKESNIEDKEKEQVKEETQYIEMSSSSLRNFQDSAEDNHIYYKRDKKVNSLLCVSINKYNLIL